MERIDAVIAGVNKAGTTSLFVSLAEHPDVVASAIKETRYFSPARYGRALAPEAVWDGYFPGPDRAVRLEATPSSFYGGAAVAQAMQSVLVNPRVVIVLREPVSRAVSFFEYQKIRLRFPPELSIEEYLAVADALTDEDLADPDHEKYMAVRGGRYADWLPDWWDVLGADAVKVVFFEDLISDGNAVLREVAGWLGLDVALLGAAGLRSENRTTRFRNVRLQAAALAFNDRMERILRRMPGFKRGLRALYFRLNGNGRRAPDVSDAVLSDLSSRFAEPNRRLAALLDGAGIDRPAWLVDA